MVYMYVYLYMLKRIHITRVVPPLWAFLGLIPLRALSGLYEYIRTDAARMQRAERRARLDCNSHETC